MHKQISIFSLVLLLLFVTGCSYTSKPGELISSKKTNTATTAQINASLQALTAYGLTNITAAYNVDSYLITYKTTGLNGKLITASGVLHVPQKATPSPLLSAQHGTIFLNSEAPSKSIAPSSEAVISSSLGFVTSEPDYLGFGASQATLEHPYSHSKTLASSSIDMLRAAKTFLTNKSIATNGQLFLMGYSEGGKATLAMQRKISTSLANEFTITASSPGSGNYDMSTTTLAILNSAGLQYPAFVAWVIKAYDDIYALNKLTEIISPSYVSAVRTSFDGTKSGADINSTLTQQTAELIQPSFISSYFAGNEPELTAAIADNNDFDWTPKAPTSLFHGQEDRSVPYLNSANAYNKMISNGSSSVQLKDCYANGFPTNHANCYFPYLNHVYGFSQPMPEIYNMLHPKSLTQ